jgi:hypothetical protein
MQGTFAVSRTDAGRLAVAAATIRTTLAPFVIATRTLPPAGDSAVIGMVERRGEAEA